LISLNFSGCILIVEISDGTMEGVIRGSGAVEEGVEPDREWLGDVVQWVIWWEEEFNGIWFLVVLLPCQQKGSTIVSESDVLGADEVPLSDRDLCGDPTFIWLIAVRAAGEEEVVVDPLHILLEPLL
jgi:hypothetical protein